MTWKSATKYQLLLDINNAIINQYTREGLFRSLAAEIWKIFHFDRFSINLYDRKSETLSYFATAEGIDPEGINEKIRSLERGSIARMVIQSQKPAFLYDLARYPELASARWMVKAGLKATMAFPMIVRGNVLGSIHFSFKKLPPDIFELKEFLTDLSIQVAIAVDNMLSYEQLKSTSENLEREKRFLQDNERYSYQYQEGNFLYASPPIAKIMDEVDLIAGTDAPVLITGETGTGKGHLARYIHNLSPRRDHLFVEVNCAALAPTLIESELFGHTKGAYTGADHRRTGRFEMADKGSILLDEIGELPLNTQAKLLHVLQNKSFERVGESSAISVSFRVLATSNKDLKQQIGEKEFRSDLYYRLNLFHIHVPPLRERPEDIPLLITFFTARYAEMMRKPEVNYGASAMEAINRYSWPGNVRELKNVIERLTILRSGQLITIEDIHDLLHTLDPKEEGSFLTREEMERRHVIKALQQCGGVVGGPKGAARLLDLPRSTLQYRMKKLGIHNVPFNGDGLMAI